MQRLRGGKGKAGYRQEEAEGMGKIAFTKPGNFVYPVPAVMVSCRGADGRTNIITIAWTGTVCSDPPMTYISVRKERASYEMLKESGEFVINLPGKSMAKALDYCGCVSGSRKNKWKELLLTEGKSTAISAPTIEEAPVSIECRVTQVLPLGSHDMFLAEVAAVQVDEKYMDEKGRFRMEEVELLAYSHGAYYELGEELGRFGFSVRKNRGASEKRREAAGKRPGAQERPDRGRRRSKNG